MADYTDIGEATVEVLHIGFHCFKLSRCTRILYFVLPVWYRLGRASSGIHHMAADGVIAFGSIGDFPWIYVGILIIVNETLYRAVKVDKVCIADLFPSTATGRTPG